MLWYFAFIFLQLGFGCGFIWLGYRLRVGQEVEIARDKRRAEYEREQLAWRMVDSAGTPGGSFRVEAGGGVSAT